MDLTADLLTLQAEAESRMLDVCRITRSGAADDEIDPDTGLPGTGERAIIYGPTVDPHEGKCRLRTSGAVSSGSSRQSAGDVVLEVSPVLSLPISAPAVKPEDRVEMLSSVNPSVAGLVLTVSGLVPGSQMTAQRVSVTAVID
jgi:hypothetical protein